MSGIAFIIIDIFSILKNYQTFFTVASSLYNAISSIQDFQYLHILTSICFCPYIYIYIYTHTHTHTHTQSDPFMLKVKYPFVLWQ